MGEKPIQEGNDTEPCQYNLQIFSLARIPAPLRFLPEEPVKPANHKGIRIGDFHYWAIVSFDHLPKGDSSFAIYQTREVC
jgi:hypothetical protein